MSEYQYFEFQAIDHPLTREQMAELRRWSSRAEITATRFVNEYQWGNFKGNPNRWMEDYFDAFMHVANWGTHWLMLRVPATLLSPDDVSDYRTEDGLEVWRTRDQTILSFRSETEDAEWEGGDGWLSSLITLRASLMRGDHRSLYLGWLAAAWSTDLAEDTPEPAVPPGLSTLDAPHRSLAEFLRIPSELIAVAAERSVALPTQLPERAAIAGWVEALPVVEKDALLTELLLSEAMHPLLALRQRADRELNAVTATIGVGKQRTAGELVQCTRALIREHEARRAAERAAEKTRQASDAAARRKCYLATLRGREEELWQNIDRLIDTRQAAGYKQAVDLLNDLRELADTTGAAEIFGARLRRLRDLHSRKPALIRRLDEARLVD
ncbi:hypothetical protein [Thiocapsa rosea]|uniref:Uncharacterized protein n=1 Tax=Thiocapsa rosea TaxID=69360 RepID=A0A495VDS7_9GAMM|nr:hypothetical protein [Thiocapsa rosea]RKT47551.1 hypothetical protein BDD21_5147 [Thiocapsa rosea]